MDWIILRLSIDSLPPSRRGTCAGVWRNGCRILETFLKPFQVFGRKPVLLAQVFLFGLGSAMCGAATNMNFLIGGRSEYLLYILTVLKSHIATH